MAHCCADFLKIKVKSIEAQKKELLFSINLRISFLIVKSEF